MDVLKDWLELAKEHVDPYKAKTWALKGVVGLFLFVYLWGTLFGLMAKIEGAMYNPFFIFSAAYAGIEGPYVGSALAVCAFYFVIATLAYYQYQQMGIHGRARWAKGEDIQRMQLFAEEGLLLGRRWLNYLCANVIQDYGHLWVYAPSGSGKGTGFLIPNLLNWNHSAVVLDIKRELYELTSGFRAKYGQKVYLFDPSTISNESIRINPLDFVDRHPLRRVSELKNITEILWPTSKDKGEIWQPNARSLFIALAIYMMDAKRQVTFGNILREIKLAPKPAEHLEDLVDLHFDPEHSLTLDPLVVQNFMAFLQQASKEQSGVLSSIKAGLELWEDPVVDAATSATDVDLRQLRREKITIYVGVAQGRIKRLKPLLNMFFQQCVNLLTENEPKEDEPYRVLMALDEFPMIGRLEAIKDGISFLRSYGVRMMIVCQSKVQVADVYDVNTARIFAQSCRYVVAYAPNDYLEAKEISEMLGRKTVKTSSYSWNQAMGGNTSFTGRDLMTPDEVRRFTRHGSIIIPENEVPIKARKIKYHTDRVFKKRVVPKHLVPTLDIETFKATVDKEYERAVMEIAARRKEKEEKREEEFKRRARKTNASGGEAVPVSGGVSYADIQKENEEMAQSMGYVEEKETHDMELLSENQKESLVDLFDEDYLGE